MTPKLPSEWRSWIPERIEAARMEWAELGYELTLLDEAIISYIASRDPNQNSTSQEYFATVKKAIAADGKWGREFEWRAGVTSREEIIRAERYGSPWYEVSVTCRDHRFHCGCPTVERAYGFMCLQGALIVRQFYSIGPPWEDSLLFKTLTETSEQHP